MKVTKEFTIEVEPKDVEKLIREEFIKGELILPMDDFEIEHLDGLTFFIRLKNYEKLD